MNVSSMQQPFLQMVLRALHVAGVRIFKRITMELHVAE